MPCDFNVQKSVSKHLPETDSASTFLSFVTHFYLCTWGGTTQVGCIRILVENISKQT